VGLAACLAATFLQRADYSAKVYPNLAEPPMIAVLLGVIIIAMLFGFMNGLVVSFLQVPPFITTLGMQTIIYGICLVFTGAQPIGGLEETTPRWRRAFWEISLFGVPIFQELCLTWDFLLCLWEL
jgi:methyl-galactoside transport system permease protein